jgi:hypothetical protein
MNTDKKRKFISPAVKKNLLFTDTIAFKDSFPPPGGYKKSVFICENPCPKGNL